MRLGVQWGYPFSLVRRLLIAFVLVLVSTFVGIYVVTQPTDPATILIHLIPVTLAILLSMYVAELVGVTERPLPPLTLESLFWSIATSCIVMAVGYALIPTYPPSTALIAAAPIAAALCVFLQRRWIEARGATEEAAVPAAVFAGSRADASEALAELALAPGVSVKGVILPAGVPDRGPMAGLTVMTPDEGLAWYRNAGIRLFAVAHATPEDLRPILAPCAGAGCVLERVEELVAQTQGRVPLTAGDGDLALLGRLTRQANRFSGQRLVDLLITLLVAPFALALGVLTAIAVKVTSPGPVLFRQTRVGRWGRPFDILKFRTMRTDAEKESGPVWARQDDPRVTRIGRILRATRLDEIPQLWNVLRGEMSLVGPRPERPFFVDRLRDRIPLYDARHAVRPGVTGWAQIRYPYGADENDAAEKLSYELFYTLHRSLTFYFAVLLETLKVLVFRRGSR